MNKSQKDNCISLKNYVKFVASNQGMNLQELVEKLHKHYGRTLNTSSFSTRLKRGSLTVIELLEVSDILNYPFVNLPKYENNKET